MVPRNEHHVIEITSSPEPEESPSRLARIALAEFQPRVHKIESTDRLVVKGTRNAIATAGQSTSHAPSLRDLISASDELVELGSNSSRPAFRHPDDQRKDHGRVHAPQPEQPAATMPIRIGSISRKSQHDSPEPSGKRRSDTSIPPAKRQRVTSVVQDLPISFKDVPYQINTQRANSAAELAEPQFALTNENTNGLTTQHESDSIVPIRKPWTIEEDALLRHMKEVEQASWDAIVERLVGRTRGAIQVRYSTVVKRQPSTIPGGSQPEAIITSVVASPHFTPREQRRAPRVARATNKGNDLTNSYVSWADLKRARSAANAAAHVQRSALAPDHITVHSGDPAVNHLSENERIVANTPIANEELAVAKQDSAFPATAATQTRYRELGLNGGRAWMGSNRGVRDCLKDAIIGGYDLAHTYQGTSGDIVAMSWAADGRYFAVGSVAISDGRSMQYNMQRNLLLGNRDTAILEELADHHISRPQITDSNNVNALQAMQATQDSRLFKTVTGTEFSPDGCDLYTVGEDCSFNCYEVRERAKLVYSIRQSAPISLLAVSSSGVPATACNDASGYVSLLQVGSKRSFTRLALPQRGTHEQLYPTSLRWGIADHHRHLLACTFTGRGDHDNTGDTIIWDAINGTSIDLHNPTRNAMDLSWNPHATASSIALAIATNPSGIPVGKGMRSVIQCFAPSQNEGRRILAWECPALDINNVIFCPYDENVIAASATDSCVYVWDRRLIKRGQAPLHTLCHGDSLNVLPEGQPRELVDEGVQFLSWGATRSRLFSGSSDGIVKVWNPYRAEGNAHVRDVLSVGVQRSAIMSGAFNHDFRELLIGTENGRINLFSINQGVSAKPPTFALQTAPSPVPQDTLHESMDASRALLESGQIVLRSCGAMPFRQAVQGPNYKGPFLAPSVEERESAPQKYHEALMQQHELETSLRHESVTHHNIEQRLGHAEAAVKVAHTNLIDMEDRYTFAITSASKAAAFQTSLLQAEQARQRLLSKLPDDITPCTLPCTVYRRIDIDDPDDSMRSEIRIPQALHIAAAHGHHAALPRDDVPVPCARCSPRAAARNKDGKGVSDELCLACRAQRMRLTAKCVRCCGPRRADASDEATGLCEKCEFACFRCAGIMEIKDDCSMVRCHSCGLKWEVGVLGYDLVGSRDRRRRADGSRSGPRDHTKKEAKATLDNIEHYEGLWQVRDQRP